MNDGPTCPNCHQPTPEYGGIVAYDDRREIRYGGKMVSALTGQEYLIFATLLRARGRVIKKEYMMEELYSMKVIADSEVPDMKIVDVFVCKLRKKLRLIGLDIVTIWGLGWYLREPETGKAGNEGTTTIV